MKRIDAVLRGWLKEFQVPSGRVRLALLFPFAFLILSASLCGNPTSPLVTPESIPLLPGGSVFGLDRSTTLVLAGGEEDTLDPAHWLSSADGIVGDLFSGLVRLGADMSIVPDLAASWDISPDGTVYMFHLRENVAFHDGRPFTAQDVAYSWTRALSKDTGSHTAMTYLDDIVGAKELASGQSQTLSGVRVIDDHTLEVTLDAPKVYFLDKLAYPVSWIVDQYTIDQIETQPNGTGPFKWAEHRENEAYILDRNEAYYNDLPPLEHVVYLIYADVSTRLYESGQIDLVEVSQDTVTRAQDPSDPLYGNVQAVNGLCTNYLAFDTTRPPFDDPLVRRAFSMAVDKTRYNDTIYSNLGVMAYGLYPPGLPGYTSDLMPLPYDPQAAVKALNDSTYGGASGLPEIVYTTFGSNGSVYPGDGLLVQMWQEVLGVAVKAEGLEYSSFYDAVSGGQHGQLINSSWCADFADPENFADLFSVGSKFNRGGYNNPQVEELLVQARIETQAERRVRLYQQIQQNLADDAAALFISHSSAYYLITKPYVKGYLATPIGVAQHMHVSFGNP
jgi:oligopeptide transport system substrate-binding protein